MELTNSSRFVIEKNAIDFLKVSPIYPKALDIRIAKKEQFSFHYQWDEDFKKFFRIDKEKITHITNIYKDIDLILKNIYFEKLFINVTPVVTQILEKLAWNKEKKLSIINISPLEWAIVWRILQEIWLKNIVYNFNRSLSINSPSKTLEWILYLFSYEKSDYFKEKTTEIILKIQKEQYNIQNDANYIIIDENNNKETYEHLNIDSYLKTQIWIKDQKNIYRLDTYPDENFLLSKDIKHIYVFDNDNDLWKMVEFYEKNIKNISFKKHKYTLFQERKIWYYEDYLISKNKEYLTYKKTIETKALNTYQVYNKNVQKTTYNWNDYIKSNYDKFNKKKVEKNYHYIPYIILFPILLVGFLVNDLPNWISGSSGSSGNSGGSTYIWWNYWWWGGTSNNTISTPKKESTSIIKSFWWWGFSKWWG